MEVIERFCAVLIVDGATYLKPGESKMAKIPVNISNLPTEYTPLDENISYQVVIRECKLADKTDKNGLQYLTGIKLEVTEPAEWQGRNIFVNYLAIPPAITPGMPLSDRLACEDAGVPLARFFACFKIPHDAEGFDPLEAIGCEGEVTVKTEEYQGRKSSRVSEFLA